MSNKERPSFINYKINGFRFSIIIIVILFIGFNYYQFSKITEQNLKTESLGNKITNLEQKTNDLETVLLSTQEENITFAEALEKAREEAADLERKFRKVNDNVDDLEKITKTDSELLQKYSKVFFLNEHYSPSGLETIPSKYTYEQNRKYEIHEEVYDYLIDLLKEAEDDGIDIKVISAFRSFGDQAQLKGNYTITYGAGTANQFSADQGYSEHQLGTTVDFTNSQVGASFSGFAQTETYKWLQNNAHRFGFTLSYPENNQFYEFEPWHWRFVGEDLADDLHNDNKFFYDLSQREIDKYIVNLFD